MRLLLIDGELAEVVPSVPGRAKLVYFACEPEDRLPTEIEYLPLDPLDSFPGRLSHKDGGQVMPVEGAEPNLLETFDLGQLIRKLIAKLLFKRHSQRSSE